MLAALLIIMQHAVLAHTISPVISLLTKYVAHNIMQRENNGFRLGSVILTLPNTVANIEKVEQFLYFVLSKNVSMCLPTFSTNLQCDWLILDRLP